jgi:transmembrane sensor
MPDIEQGRDMDRSDDIMEEAADWLLRHHAGLDPAGERDLSRWLARDPAHRAAFEALAGPWQALDGLAQDEQMLVLRGAALGLAPEGPSDGAPDSAPEAAPDSAPEPAKRAWHWPRALAASLALVAGGAGLWWALAGADTPVREVLETGRAQRQSFVLSDGSTVMLDAESRVDVAMTRHRRSLDLARGQAYFQVAHDRSRPFVVSAGEREVVAVGTEFDVRRGLGQVTVALMQGRVRVEPTGSFDSSQPLASGGTELTVGQALTFDHDRQRTLITAVDPAAIKGWREGLLHFDHVSLDQAVADFNRYAARPLRLGDPSLARLLVSGVFRAQDAEGFVKALTMLYPVAAQARPGEIVLIPAPR